MRTYELEGGGVVSTWDDEAPMVGLQIAPFNWRLRRAREAKGWSRAELARQSGVSPSTVGGAEKLERIGGGSQWRIALALGVPEDVLFPAAIDALLSRESRKLEIPLSAHDVVALTDESEERSLEWLGEQAALRDDIVAALETLPDRLRTAVELRCGLDGGEARTLEEVGQVLGIHRERVRQLEAKALRRLRTPRVARRLEPFLEERAYGLTPLPRGACEYRPQRADGLDCPDAFPAPAWMEHADEGPRAPAVWCPPCQGAWKRARSQESCYDGRQAD